MSTPLVRSSKYLWLATGASFFCAGLGQFMLGRYWLGTLHFLLFLGGIGACIWEMLDYLRRSFQVLLGDSTADPLSIHFHWTRFAVFVSITLLVWLWSIMDATRAPDDGRRPSLTPPAK